MLMPKLPNLQIRVKTPTTTSSYGFITKCRIVGVSKLSDFNGSITPFRMVNNGLSFATRGFVNKVTNLEKELKHAKQIIHREANVEDNKKFGEELTKLFETGRHTEAFSKYDTFRRFNVVSAENIVLVMQQYMHLQRFGKMRDLFFHLKAHQVQPALEIYEMLIEAMFIEQNNEKLINFFNRLKNDGWSPTDYLLTTVIRAHMRSDKLSDVDAVIKQFQEKEKFKWNISVLNEYITLACKHGNQARAEQLAFNKELPHDELTFARLIQFYLSYQDMNKVEKAVEFLRASNLHQTGFSVIPDVRFQKLKIPKLTFRVSFQKEGSAVGVAWEGGSRSFHLGPVESEWEALLLGLNTVLSMADVNTLEEIAITYPAILTALGAVNQKGMDEIPWSNTPFALLLRNALKWLGQSPNGIKLTIASKDDPTWKALGNNASKCAKREREHILFDPVINPSTIIPPAIAAKYISVVEGVKGTSAYDMNQTQQ